jgi:hypothetical protein
MIDKFVKDLRCAALPDRPTFDGAAFADMQGSR